jgi:hypothetical protein
VDAIRVTGGRFNLTDAARSPAQALEVALTDLELEIFGFGGDDSLVAVEGGWLEVADPALGSKQLRLEIGDIDLAVREGGRVVDLTQAKLSAGKSVLALAGTVESQAEGLRMDIDLKPTTIEVVDLSSFLESAAGDLGVSLSGKNPVELEAGVHGVLAADQLPGMIVVARLSDLTIETAALTKPVNDLNATATLRGAEVEVAGLRARVGDTDFAGTLQFALRDRPALGFTIESRRADLGELLGLMGGGESDVSEAAPPDPDSFLVRSVADGTLKVSEGSWANLNFRDLEARLRLENGVAVLDPVSMRLYDGRFDGRLASDLRRVPQSFEFSGEAENVDIGPFLADQAGKGDVLMGRFTGRVDGQGMGSDPATLIRSLEGQGVARIVDGQVGKLDLLRSIGQVAGVFGQRTLANLASESVTGATKFSRLASDFEIGGGSLNFDSVLLQSSAFDLSGRGTVNMVSSIMNGRFQIEFSPQVSAWMREESSRAAELFWDPRSNRVVLPFGLSGPLEGAGASVDWGAAVESAAVRTVERELDDLLRNLLGGSSQETVEQGAVTSLETTPAAPADRGTPALRAESASGAFAIEITKTWWGGSFFAQDFKIRCQVTGEGARQAALTAVDAGGREIQKKSLDLAPLLGPSVEGSFEIRVDGKRLLLVDYPVTVILAVIGADNETAEVTLGIEAPGR